MTPSQLDLLHTLRIHEQVAVAGGLFSLAQRATCASASRLIVIILTPVDGYSAAAAAEEAKYTGASVISYDRLILSTDAVDYYVTFDMNATGAAQAQDLVDKATGTGNSLLYAGASSDPSAPLFKDVTSPV